MLRYKGYLIVKERGHYIILQGNNKIMSVDTVTEAKEEIDALEEEYINCMRDSLNSTGQWW